MRLSASSRDLRLSLLVASLNICVFVSSDLKAQVTVNANTGAGSGIVMTESTTPVSTSTNQDAIFSDFTTHRLRVINNNASSSIPLATFPCVTSQGCIVYAGGLSSPYVETSLTLTTVASGVTAGPALLAGSTAPGWGGVSLDLQGYSVVNEMTAVTGANAPVQNELVILNTSSASTVQIATTSTTTGLEGICIANCSSGATNAQIARSGIASCKFDVRHNHRRLRCGVNHKRRRWSVSRLGELRGLPVDRSAGFGSGKFL